MSRPKTDRPNYWLHKRTQLGKNRAQLLRRQLLTGERILERATPHKSKIGQATDLPFAKEQIVCLIAPQTVGIAHDHRI